MSVRREPQRMIRLEDLRFVQPIRYTVEDVRSTAGRYPADQIFMYFRLVIDIVVVNEGDRRAVRRPRHVLQTGSVFVALYR